MFIIMLHIYSILKYRMKGYVYLQCHLYQIIYYILQSGRAPLHEIMSAKASLHDADHLDFHDILEVVDRLIGAGADVNVVDKVSYCQAR